MPKTIASLVAFAVALATSAVSQQPAPTPPEHIQQPDSHTQKHENRTADSQRVRPASPPPHAPIPSPTTQPQPPEHPGEQQKSSPEEWGLVIATWALVFITGGLAFYTARLWNATKTLADDARIAAERQAKDVRESLDIGERTIAQMGDTAERQLRAYMTINGGKIFCESRYGGWWLEWHPVITNVGQTPAYGVRVYTMADIRPVPLPGDTDLIGELEPGEGSRSTVGPGGSVFPAANLNGPISDSELEQLKARENRRRGEAFYVWGRVTYRDIFQKERHTNFCMLADWDNAGKPIGKSAPQYNEAD
jgi:hypothetical protein